MLFCLAENESGLLKTEKFSLLLEFVILTNLSYRYFVMLIYFCHTDFE